MLDRREFLIGAAGSVILAMTDSPEIKPAALPASAGPTGINRTKISLVKTSDRASGIKQTIELLRINPVKGRKVLLKPNFNTADPFPASTHKDTLAALIANIRTMGAESITLGERSGPPDTGDVLRDKGIHELCRWLDVRLINFEELPDSSWVKVKPEHSHWINGFYVARPVIDAECIVTTCCLKTHAYGGVFTMSLKLSVGVTHKKNMKELHASFLSMRKMIAEINQAYTPSLILLDGIEAFVDGGPSKGKMKRADVLIAGTDRIAIDAAGLAVLKELGSNKAIMERRIFEQEQIKSAAELGLGVTGPEGIEIVTGDEQSLRYAERLKGILAKG